MSEARIQVDAVFRCPTCRGVPYKLFRRSTPEHPELFTHLVWPTEIGVPPPLSPTLRCPTDGAELQREAS